MSVSPFLNMAGNPPAPSYNLPQGSVSASRIPWSPSQAAEAMDGAAIRTTGDLKQTGIAPLDKTAERVQAVADHAPDAVSQASAATLRGGLYGSICGGIIGLVNQGPGIIADAFGRKPPAGLVVIALFTAIGGMLGGLLGFIKNSRQQAEELKTLLFH